MNVKTDVLIVGTGIAGMYSALNLREDLNIVMITKSKVEECNTYLAQGGISTAKNINDEKLYIQDTLKAGNYKNDVQAVEILVSESRKNIEELVSLGVKFDMNETGFDYTKEGAHSINRIVHCADETGKSVFNVLYERVTARKNITIYEDTCLIDLINTNNNCYGGIVVKDGEVIKINSKVTILACGGIGGLFKNSTNQRSLTGDGIAIALRNNIDVMNLDYIQFHPTALYEDNSNNKRFLISESLRGEGAYLINNNGERFVDELLPRDVVTKAILEEEKKTNSKYVYLDISHKPKEFIINRFPYIYETCKEKGIDITKDKIPVTPVQHYFMGGIKVDSYSKTSMVNLFACGEVSCTGIHGSNRLASNSLLEGLVFSKRAAENINKNINYIKLKDLNDDLVILQPLNIIKLAENLITGEILKARRDIKYELVND